MAKALDVEAISTKCRRIAEQAKEDPQRVFTSLAYFIDLDWLREAYRALRGGLPELLRARAMENHLTTHISYFTGVV